MGLEEDFILTEGMKVVFLTMNWHCMCVYGLTVLYMAIVGIAYGNISLWGIF